nr:copia protein [Tanacetum cinerariifolium]
DERGIVIRNKERLVAQGHTQEKGIDYDEVFAPVARIKAIRLFLAYTSFKDFVVYQMDVKSDFLYGKIKEEIVIENHNHLNEPNEAILEVNPVVPEPNQVVDIHDPNEMADIPDDIDLVDYDKEDPEEDPEKVVDIKLEDAAKLIFPYEVKGDKTPSPGDVSSDSVSSESESEDEEVDVAPEATAGTTTQKPYAICDFPKGLFEVGESSSARDSSNVDGLAPWAIRRDLEASHA